MFSHFESNGEMWAGTGDRSLIHNVSFTADFVSPPSVQTSITLMDAASDQHLRYILNAENISENDFDIVFKTWLDSRFARVWVSWIAIGKVRDPDMWDV